MSEDRIAYVINNAPFFVSHRLPIALKAVEYGFSVSLFAGRTSNSAAEVAAESELQRFPIEHRKCSFQSASVNPITEVFGLLQIIWHIYRSRPKLVHCASPKGVLYGGIAARLCCVPGVVFSISGLGFAFTDSPNFSLFRKYVRFIYHVLSKFAFNHKNVRVIVQNKDDYDILLKKKLATNENLVLIEGSGVDLEIFKNCKPENKENLVIFPARLLRDKGVVEFALSARYLKSKVHNWRFVLVGEVSCSNPSSITNAELEAWVSEGIVEYIGYLDDMLPLFSRAAIVCLPSYREGMPKALLEAAAAGCAVVTTDAVGCKDAVIPGATGELVRVGDHLDLSRALLSLIKSAETRVNYGAAGQAMAAERFSISTVVSKTISIYKEMIKYN